MNNSNMNSRQNKNSLLTSEHMGQIRKIRKSEMKRSCGRPRYR